MSIVSEIRTYGEKAVLAKRELVKLSTEMKNTVLFAMADALANKQSAIIEENKKDLAAGEARGLGKAMLDRLMLNEKRIGEMSEGVRQVAALKDSVGEIISEWTQPNGLRFQKVRSPIGVIGIIYESRPNVTADCTALCLKSGNAVILRGGSEAIHSNIAIFEAMEDAATKAGLPQAAMQLVRDTDREAVRALLELEGYVDLVIPRGGEGLIRKVVEYAKVPVIKQYKGVCHTYVDKSADLKMGVEIAFNAKVQRPSVCNAMECLLVHAAVAQEFLPLAAGPLVQANVEIRGDARTCEILPSATPATDADWGTEFLDYILAVRVVKDLDQAVEHIAQYGSGHSEAIITSDEKAAAEFLNRVDASSVYVNASTRFTDGGQFGMGAEIGISTDKLHARGP
ncbi:MAG: glutamate-5-semialdehyde dehydrogenase, partial [Candidatus Omnitrophica bacterium]|nr:glutamate-5-semialdehyde dehydrogenase [Candidatus Omnitrophota bacterium]